MPHQLVILATLGIQIIVDAIEFAWIAAHAIERLDYFSYVRCEHHEVAVGGTLGTDMVVICGTHTEVGTESLGQQRATADQFTCDGWLSGGERERAQ